MLRIWQCASWLVLRIPVDVVNTRGHKFVTRRTHIYLKGDHIMIDTIVQALSGAFTQVVGVVETFLGDEGLFGAIESLSSGIFG